jgi:hypothetical protein
MAAICGWRFVGPPTISTGCGGSRAGGGNDTVARLIQRDLEKALGEPLVIENKRAGSGIVGTEQVAKAAPDGYSLLMAFTTHTVNPAVTAKLPYDTERDLAPGGPELGRPLAQPAHPAHRAVCSGRRQRHGGAPHPA